MIPSGRLVLLLLAPLVAAALAIYVTPAVPVVIALDLLVLAAAAADAFGRRPTIRIVREAPPTVPVAREVKVHLRVSHDAPGPLTLDIADDAPGAVSDLPVTVLVPAGREVVVTYRIRVDRRGRFRFGDVVAQGRSALGLWGWRRSVSLGADVHVLPDVARFRQWALEARLDLRMPSRVSVRRPGADSEFQRLRPYVVGDPFKHVDWRATARRSSLVSREFGQERGQNVILLVDAGRMTSGRFEGRSLFDHGLDAALALGHAALRHGDRVGMLVYDRSARVWLPPRGGARSGGRLVRAVFDQEPSDHASDHDLAFNLLATRVRQRCLVVVISSIIDDVEADLADRLVSALARRHLPLCVMLRDPAVEARLSTGGDPWSQGAAAELMGWRARRLERLQQRGALVVDATPGRVTPALLARYLEIKATRAL